MKSNDAIDESQQNVERLQKKRNVVSQRRDATEMMSQPSRQSDREQSVDEITRFADKRLREEQSQAEHYHVLVSEANPSTLRTYYVRREPRGGEAPTESRENIQDAYEQRLHDRMAW